MAAVNFGVMGACRRQELHGLLFENVKDLNGAFLVNVLNTKYKTDRTFTITGKYYQLIMKYIDLRPVGCRNDNFFIKYYNGKCTIQNIGTNAFGNMGKTVASYMKFQIQSCTLVTVSGGPLLLCQLTQEVTSPP